MTLKLGIPSKGRLREQSIAWLRGRNLEVAAQGSEREYSARITGASGVTPVLLNANDIARELAMGSLHLGITGMDVVAERVPLPERRVERIAGLGFGHADLVIAVPACWIDVDTVDDLDSVAHRFRKAHGFRLRIATKYHNLARSFLAERGIADYQLVDSQGATEGAVQNKTAEAIADITTTGDTLRANHLKPLVDGTVLRSQAGLFRSRGAELDGAQERACAQLLEALGLGPGRVLPPENP